MAKAICSPSAWTSPSSAIVNRPSWGRRTRVSTPYPVSPSDSGTDSTDVAFSAVSSGSPSSPAPRIPVSSTWATTTGWADSCTRAGIDPGGGSTAATRPAWPASPGSSGPTANWRRSRCQRSRSTMASASSSAAISRAHRCRVRDSLKPWFSSSTRAAAVTRSRWRVMVCTEPAGGRRAEAEAGAGAEAEAVWPGGPGRPGRLGRSGRPGSTSRTATTSGPGSSRTLTWPISSSLGTRPSSPSRLARTRRGWPVRLTAPSCDCTAAREGRLTNAANWRPVA